MDKEERLRRSKVFSRIAEVRKDAVNAKKFAEKDGGSEYHFWDGYLEAVDYLIFVLQDIKYDPKKERNWAKIHKERTKKAKGK